MYYRPWVTMECGHWFGFGCCYETYEDCYREIDNSPAVASRRKVYEPTILILPADEKPTRDSKIPSRSWLVKIDSDGSSIYEKDIII